METILLVAFLILLVAVLFLGFLLLGTLRALGLLGWCLEQLGATTPKRLGRDGLKPGKKAPDFSLPSAEGKEMALHDFAGRRVLLVFTQSGCSPCTQSRIARARIRKETNSISFCPRAGRISPSSF